MKTEDSLSRDECLGSIPNAFLSFVHDDHLWAFAPEKFMRWRPSRLHPAESDRWEPSPYVWDFGARVVVPEHWLTWLSRILASRSTEKDYRPLNPIGVKRDATLVFEDVMKLGVRKLIVVQPEHPFRGEDLVVVLGAPFVRLWGLSVGILQQLNPRKDAEGRSIPWPGDYFRGDVPVNMRFDTCLPKQNIAIDVEVGPPTSPAGIGEKNLHSDFEVRIELRGTELLKRKDT
jgi:hypothetical protein